MDNRTPFPQNTFQNPVYNNSFPDPFVLKYGGSYFGYCTGLGTDGRVFSILNSTDLVNWVPLGSAMEPLASGPPLYWAPEVTAAEGKFYLYYSVGNEELMEIRVAVSERPDGGFVDSGYRLTTETFAIDPHVFTDPDGTSYLFYATDFLDHSHVGTGTVVDRMVDRYTLAGEPWPVTRAKYDWQVYDPKRENKGGVRWHTVEGPFVLSRKGRLFEMFSGGNWQNTTYGVSFAVALDIAQFGEWEQVADGEDMLPILRTVPDRIVGPGHNCVVRGPNNRELYCVYHRWTESGRVLAIDRMDFAGDRIFIIGATDTPQPSPLAPAETGFGPGWEKSSASKWSRAVPRSFLSEFTVNNSVDVDTASVELSSPGLELFFPLPAAEHSVRVEVDGRWAKLTLDGWQVLFEGWLKTAVSQMTLVAANVDSRFSSFTLTKGFEDLCDRGVRTATDGEWQVEGPGTLDSAEREMIFRSYEGLTRLGRDDIFNDLDIAVNIGVLHPTPETEFGLLLTSEGNDRMKLSIGREVTLEYEGDTSVMRYPAGWQREHVHQYRLLVRDGTLMIYLEDVVLAETPFTFRPLQFAVFCGGGAIAIEMIRVTEI
jgi:GH43 family beta-xylosidase